MARTRFKTSINLPRSAAAVARIQAWYWRLPYAAITLLAICLLVFVWLGLKAEDEEKRSKLINDVLWMEQHLHRHFDSIETSLAPLASVLDADSQLSNESRTRVRPLLLSDTGLIALSWLSATGKPQLTIPPREALKLEQEVDEAVRRARSLSRTTYSRPFMLGDKSWGVAVVVPGYDDSRLTGFIIGKFSFSRLLAQQVPWWFAERYRLSIDHSDGHEMASKSKVDVLDAALRYIVALEPPGGDVSLRVEAYAVPSEHTAKFLVGAIIVFGVIMLWSLWMLRRQLLRLSRTQTELRTEHAFRQAMEDSMLIGLRARNLDGRITYVNSAFCKMLGFTAEELIGMRPPMAYWLPEERTQTQLVHDRILASTKPMDALELRFRRKNGEVFDALLFESPLIDGEGRHAGWMGSLLDVTARKRAEALARDQQDRLEATSRLVTMGEMASSLAHEINQPLSAISSYSAGCLNAMEAGRLGEPELIKVLGKINLQAQRAGRIIRRVYAFVRRSEPRYETVDANSIVQEAIGLVETDIRRRSATLETDLSTDLPLIDADPVMIEQVLVNLIRNGMDAMAELPTQDRRIKIRSESDADWVRIIVIDNGNGISDEIADKLFDSFFTTKSEGMGMGLKICRSIAEQHHGRLWFENNPDGGAAFHLQLPVAAAPQETENE